MLSKKDNLQQKIENSQNYMFLKTKLPQKDLLFFKKFSLVPDLDLERYYASNKKKTLTHQTFLVSIRKLNERKLTPFLTFKY